jgi:aspartyl-tRNA(Asn)/glutamyl-tRNA(Gln) amidotransferase subunit C
VGGWKGNAPQSPDSLRPCWKTILNILEQREGKGKRNVEITKQEVEKVAKLARLELTDIEKAAFAKQLSQILTHVETLKQYDTTGVEPTATVLGQVNVFRPDVARPSLPVERAVANAPESADGFFVVPKIIEDRQPL